MYYGFIAAFAGVIALYWHDVRQWHARFKKEGEARQVEMRERRRERLENYRRNMEARMEEQQRYLSQQ